MRQIFSTVMASVQNIGINSERNKVDNDPHTAAAMSKESSSHHQLNNNRSQGRDSYWFAYGRADDASPANAEQKATAEEKIRVFREHQEEERMRKLRGLEQHFLVAKQHREQQEQERRRRIEEARVREADRRQQVEERKRQIWEAEQERKEAILRRNMEREARIEARRNAQRNAQSFAFGSSTPRTFDLDLAAIGLGRHANALLMSSVGRRSEERDTGPPRATSACSLDRKFGEDCMSRSMVSLSSSSSSTFRGRRRTDITPTPGRERSVTPHLNTSTTTTPRGSHPTRAVSMTRLDQLAQPRRTYLLRPNAAPQPNPDLSRSMCNLAPPPPPPRRGAGRSPGMSRSMLHLGPAQPPRRSSPTHAGARQGGLRPAPTQQGSRGGLRPAQSMMQLAPPPRLTRAARLRAEALAGARAASAWNLSSGGGGPDAPSYLSPGKDSSRSPSRPQSSMSGTSDISATSSSVSAVNMRPRPAPRRPRPYSVAGSMVSSAPAAARKEQADRQPRGHSRSATAPRAKSACRGDIEDRPLLSAPPRKPLPPPKSSDLIARAKAHPVPTKDNLRKVNKSSSSRPAADKAPPEQRPRPNADQKMATDKIECKRKEQEEEAQLNSTLTSPTTDSEMLPVSSDDSKTGPTSDVSQSVTESESPFAQKPAPPEEKVSINGHNIPIEVSAPTTSEPHKSPEEEEEETKAVTGAESPASTSSEEAVQRRDDSAPSKSQAVEEALACQEESPAPSKQTKAPLEEESKAVPKPASSKQTRTPLEEESRASESPAPSKPRISSEEEARAALAEKRRLAREQAEREAELERQRLEEIRRQEEEQRLLEEQEQRRMEEEQLRLAALHRQLEEQKLAKAIQEQQQREKEEQERREEEARQRLEKEEQERKVREEAEKQRVELEEKLRREEEERAERKRRVEQIMARTRGKTAAASQQSPSTPPTHAAPAPEPSRAQNGNPLPDILNAAILSGKRNGAFVVEERSFEVSNGRSANEDEEVSPQHSNGYASHEDMSCNTSPEESPLGLLIDIQGSQQNVNNTNNNNFLIHLDDDVNSNVSFPADPFSTTTTESNMAKKQDTTQVTDLLS